MPSLVEMVFSMETKETIEKTLDVTDVGNISNKTTSKGKQYVTFSCNRGKGYIVRHNGTDFGNGTWKDWQDPHKSFTDSLIDDICSQLEEK